MIKELVAKIGLDNSGFVGTMQETVGMIDGAKKGMADLGKTLKVTAGGFTGGANAAKIFKVALASTGIGAIVVALGSLVAYLTTTQAGMDKLRQVTEPVSQIFERLLGVLQNLGGNVFKGIAQMLNGELKEGFKTLSEGAKQAGRETVGAFKEGITAGRELANLHKEIEEAQNELILTQSKLNREIAEQREISQDQNRSEGERRKAAQRAIELINQRVQAEDKVLALQEKNIRLRQQANDTDRQGIRELNEIIAQRMDLEAAAARERSRLNSIGSKERASEIKDVRSIIDLQREQLKLFLDMTKDVSQRADPFSMEEQAKFSKETLKNVTEISNKLIRSKTEGLGIIITDEQRKNVEIQKDNMAKLNREIMLGNELGLMLGQTFSNAFQAMLINGELSFKGLLQGLKALIAQLIAAAAAAFTLNLLLGGIGLGKTSTGSLFGGMTGFKDLFSNLSGMPRFAKGGMVTGLTTAVLGDNPSGKEAVIPFERMGEFLGKFGGGGTQRVEVVGNFRNDAIYFSNASYSQRRNRILNY